MTQSFSNSIQQYGIISLCLFCLVFTGAFVWVFLQSKSHLDRMARAPLEPEPEPLPTALATERSGTAQTPNPSLAPSPASSLPAPASTEDSAREP